MVATYPPTSNNADTSAQTAVLDAADSTYSLLYFDTQGVLNPTRNLLALGDATWTQLYPLDWDNEDQLDKESTPFGVMPVLYVHAKDGSLTVPIAESRVIELYLAEKFGFLGKNSYERLLITSFASSTAAVWDTFISTVASAHVPPEAKQAQLVHFLTKIAPQWIRIHEEHLKANGLNGHYVGDTITLADLRAAAFIDLIQRFPPGAQLLTPETTPGLLKVKDVIDNHPKIMNWRASELYKSQRSSRAVPALPAPSSVRLNDRQGNKSGGI
ncbi:hypothetical protein BGZ51_000507 [Haplosporangium sp. Z 767]|nr:hypothetical protein BGZ51_000507 [Haplosporangium sp. Z 767]KAF9190776.1 hypothetical protein BGZ50_009827 [Haplosporangium sp. Z 11]